MSQLTTDCGNAGGLETTLGQKAAQLAQALSNRDSTLAAYQAAINANPQDPNLIASTYAAYQTALAAYNTALNDFNTAFNAAKANLRAIIADWAAYGVTP